MQDLPLYNHEIPVAKASNDPLPAHVSASAAGRAPLYHEIHDTYLHEADGSEHYSVDLDLAAAHLVRHKDDPASLDAVACVLANRAVGINLVALQGETEASWRHRVHHAAEDAGQILTMDDLDTITAIGTQHGITRMPPKTSAPELLYINHPEAFLTADGPERKRILPLDLLAVSRIYAFHHKQKTKPEHPKIPHGGQHSVKAIAALDALLSDIGLQPNHEAIKARFCINCPKGS